MQKFFKLIIISTMLLFCFNFVLADTILPTSSTARCSADYIKNGGTNCGDYSLNDFVQLAVNVSKYILSIVGSLALLMFIYGGFMMLISSGSQEKVKKGRDILVGAVIGLAIVFASYLIIGFIWHSLNDKVGVAEWATSNFNPK